MLNAPITSYNNQVLMLRPEVLLMVLSHLLMICQKVLFLALVVEKTLLQLLLILQAYFSKIITYGS